MGMEYFVVGDVWVRVTVSGSVSRAAAKVMIEKRLEGSGEEREG